MSLNYTIPGSLSILFLMKRIVNRPYLALVFMKALHDLWHSGKRSTQCCYEFASSNGRKNFNKLINSDLESECREEKTIQQYLPLLHPLPPHNHTNRLGQCLFSGHIKRPAGTALPRRRPLDLFFFGFDPGMEAGFVLITCWNFKFYGVLKAGDEASRCEAGESALKPSLVNRHCMFVCHTQNKASIVPSWIWLLLKIKCPIKPLCRTRGVILKNKGRSIGLH